VLVTQGTIVAVLIGGISWLAHVTHATPYRRGVPTVLAQEASLVFGPSVPGRVMFLLVQAGTAAILFTGGNTSFSGFPFLASFVAEDSFLPRWLTKRGHRLAFSNGIIMLTVACLALLAAVGALVDALVPFYAIGVFTGFAMAGFGMARYHHKTREAGWRRRLVINAAGGAYTALVVALFAVVKFTEGAWLVVALFPALVFALIRLNREYRVEAAVLEDLGDRTPPGLPNYPHRSVLVLVDALDLATLAALRYASSLHPTTLRAVHFVLDNARAGRLRDAWLRAGLGVPLDLVDCADRRLTQAAAELAAGEADRDGTHVTLVLPRRSYSLLPRRLLHDHTADKIAHMVSRVPDSAATIVPFDVQHAAKALATHKRLSQRLHLAAPAADPAVQAHDRPPVPPGADPIGSLAQASRSTVEGRVHTVEIRPVDHSCVLACTVADATGQLTALFYGRQNIPGVEPGTMIRLHGTTGHSNGATTMVNPSYELIPQVA
jgi:hypothetical protein